ncbi:DNA repair protein Rad34p [Monosporozyma servazzii]
MKRKYDSDEDILNNNSDNNLFILSSDSDSDIAFETNFDGLTDNEEELSDIEWEEVPLEQNPDKDRDIVDVQITINPNDHISNKKKRVATSIEKRRLIHESKKLAFNINIVLIPFLLKTLIQRSEWTKDTRLNRRLKRSVPKLIQQKFQTFKYKRIVTQKQENALMTLLLGVVQWFRTHYQINSNGFRQHFSRLRYLSTKQSASKKYNYVLDHPKHFYGTRPDINLEDPLESIREMARKKMSNRDILVIFFAIILQNLLNKDDYEISICFALPLLDYDTLQSSIEKNLPEVPNRFDSDLIHPYFWLELNHYGKIIVVDPLVHLRDGDVVSINKPDIPVKYFEPTNISNQKYSFVSRVNVKTLQISDISPRYIRNITFRYFQHTQHYTLNPISPHYKLYQYYMESIDKVNQKSASVKPVFNNFKLCSILAYKNVAYPTTIKELVRSDNFVIATNLKAFEIINPNAKAVCTWKVAHKVYPLYWKKDVIVLKSKQHWNILGRTVVPGSQPLKTKKYVPMKNKKHAQYKADYEIRELYSMDQTDQTPSLPEYIINEYGQQVKIKSVFSYKNKFGNVEIYLDHMKPTGFKILQLNNLNIKPKQLLNTYNRKNRESIEYLDIVSGFDFKEKPGFAIPIINSILLSDQDFERAQKLISDELEMISLNDWSILLRKLQIRNRLIDTYDK